ncbi:MAG: GIY-YIG nuclease family protein [Bacteroidota bacterium]
MNNTEINPELMSHSRAIDPVITIYIILSHRGTYYCGITNNLKRRWKEHCTGQSKYLSTHKAKEIVYTEFAIGYEAARKREKKIKQIGPGKFMKIQSLISFNRPINSGK